MPRLTDFSFFRSHKKTFGHDKVLGSVVIPNVWDSITPGEALKTLELPLTGGPGALHISLSVRRRLLNLASAKLTFLRIKWTPNGAFLSSPDPDSRSIAGSVSPSVKARSRFSSTFSRKGREASVEPSD